MTNGKKKSFTLDQWAVVPDDYEGEIPGAAAKDCGNYLDQNLPMANYLAKKYLKEALNNPSEKNLIYPE